MNRPRVDQPFPTNSDHRARELETSAHVRLPDAIVAFIERQNIKGSTRQLLVALADPLTTRVDFANRIADLPPTDTFTLGEVVLDAILFVVDDALADHTLTDSECRMLRRLQHIGGLGEGELLARRPEHVAALLEREMRRLLADRTIEPAEALHQVALQEVLGLSYDEYRQLTRPAVSAIVDEFIRNVTADSAVTPNERIRLESQIQALDTAYRFTPTQRAQLAAAGLVIDG